MIAVDMRIVCGLSMSRVARGLGLRVGHAPESGQHRHTAFQPEYKIRWRLVSFALLDTVQETMAIRIHVGVF